MSWESPRFWNLIVRWPSWPAEGKGDGKGANRSGTNGALDRQNDRRNSALPKAAGIAPQARWDEMGWDVSIMQWIWSKVTLPRIFQDVLMCFNGFDNVLTC